MGQDGGWHAITTIDTCDLGHKFAKLTDHPQKDGKSRCPHCMAIGLDNARSDLRLAPEQNGYVSVIEVEKLICEKLSRKWEPSGMSISSLVDELVGR